LEQCSAPDPGCCSLLVPGCCWQGTACSVRLHHSRVLLQGHRPGLLAVLRQHGGAAGELPSWVAAGADRRAAGPCQPTTDCSNACVVGCDAQMAASKTPASQTCPHRQVRSMHSRHNHFRMPCNGAFRGSIYHVNYQPSARRRAAPYQTSQLENRPRGRSALPPGSATSLPPAAGLPYRDTCNLGVTMTNIMASRRVRTDHK
jgi:hypothetical protein